MIFKIINKSKFLILLIFGFLLVYFHAKDLKSYDYSDSSISTLEVITDNKETELYAKKVFKEVLNTKLFYKRISEIIKIIQKMDSVDKVTASVEEIEKGKVKLTIVVRSKFKAVLISFEGNQNYSDGKLRSLITLNKDSLVDTYSLENYRRELADFYVKNGFLKAEVSYERIYSQAKDSGTINFKINEGKQYKITDFQLIGDLANLNEKDILKMLAIKKGAPLNSEDVELKLNRLTEKLVREDFLTTKIEGYSVDYSGETENVVLKLNLNLGARTKVVFSGNKYFSERNSKLREVIRISEEKQFGNAWIEASKFELERFYMQQGYALVKISSEDKYYKEKSLRIVYFKINKGNKILIKDIAFKGNNAFSGDFLKRKLLSFDIPSIQDGFYVKEDFRKGLKGLLRYYQSQGYLNAERAFEPVEEFDAKVKRVSLTVSLSEGEKFFATSLHVEGNIFLDDSQIEEFVKINKGDPFNPELVSDGIEKLRNFYLGKGFKFVKIYSKEEIEGNNVSIGILVSEGDRVKIGKIVINGNSSTDENIIRREFIIKEEDYYSPDSIKESEGNVAKLGLFTSVVLLESDYDSREQKLNLVLKVEEKKKRSLRTRVGYGSDEGLRGGADLTFINIGGKGRSISFGAQLSHRLKSENILRRKEDISFREPRLFGSKLAGKIGFIDERDEEPQFNIDRSAVSLGADTSISKTLRASTTWNLEYRKPFDLKIAETELSPFDESRKRLAYIDVSVDYDKRNDIFNATKGFLNRFSVDTYNKSLWSQHNFVQFYSSNSLYVPLYKRIKSIVSLKFGFSATYGSTKTEGIPIPVEKRFRLGGGSSLRGFPRNSVGGLTKDQPAVTGATTKDQAPGGKSVFNYNLELVFPFLFGFDFVLFTDGGEAYRSNWDFNPFNIRNTAGIGLRYDTPIGPLKLDWGFILDRRTGEGWGGFEFAVGML